MSGPADNPQGSCVLCYRRDPLPDLVPVCGPCRSKGRAQLHEVPVLVAFLGAGSRRQIVPGDLTTVRELALELGDEEALGTLTGEQLDVLIEGHAAEGSAHLARRVGVEAGPVPGLRSGPRVSTSGEAPVPIKVDRVDLLAEVDERTVHDSHHAPVVQVSPEPRWVGARIPGRDDGEALWQEVRDRQLVRQEKTFHCRCGNPALHANQPARPVLVPSQDQTGYVSAATVLHRMCEYVAETRRESVPHEDVTSQCRFLLDRWDWICDVHPAVDGLAVELGDLWHALYRTAGLTVPKPQVCWGVECRNPECGYTSTLVREHGSDYIECTECGLLLDEDAYKAWLKLLAADAKRRTVVPRD